MADKTISINPFDVDSWNKAIKEVEDYQNYIDRAAQRLIELLAQTCEREAKVQFTQAIYSGLNDVEVTSSIQKVGKNYVATVRADGETVLFIEFGTGILNPYPERMDEYITVLPSGHGQYGKGHGMSPKGWVYYGQRGNSSIYYTIQVRPGVFRTIGNPANSSMYKALIKTEAEITKCVKEAFKL